MSTAFGAPHCDSLFQSGFPGEDRLNEIARNLNNPRYILEDNLVKSSNKTYIVVDRLTAEKVALYKPNSGIVENLEDLYPVTRDKISLREELAYRLSQVLGISNIAPAVRVDTLTHSGALVLWQKGFQNYYDFWVSRYQTYPAESIEELEYLTDEKENLKIQELTIFDYIIGNLDRNLKNFLINDEFSIIGIDHSISFPLHSDKPRGVVNHGWNRGDTAKTLINSRLIDKVASIHIENFILSIQQEYPLLDTRALNLTRERLELIQYLISKKEPISISKISSLMRFHSIRYKRMELERVKNAGLIAL